MQYFHPDNMSSAEKLKVELGKVRDEFKMSESDCGSARVQGIVFNIVFHYTCFRYRRMQFLTLYYYDNYTPRTIKHRLGNLYEDVLHQ